MIPEASGPTKQADEQAFAAQVAEAQAASDARQQQAGVFQESRTPTEDVTAGQERL
jgi:hypothetical protein